MVWYNTIQYNIEFQYKKNWSQILESEEVSCLTMLHLFDKNNVKDSNIVIYYNLIIYFIFFFYS